MDLTSIYYLLQAAQSLERLANLLSSPIIMGTIDEYKAIPTPPERHPVAPLRPKRHRALQFTFTDTILLVWVNDMDQVIQ